MKRYIKYIGCLLMAISTAGCNDFLDREPLDKLVDDTFWKDEGSLRAYTQDFYSTFFIGYAQDYLWFGGYYTGDYYNDDVLLVTETTAETNRRLYFAQNNTGGINAATTTVNAITSVWSDQYKAIRKANVMLEKIPAMDIPDEQKKHWTGTARFFRAMAYSALVKAYGDVPFVEGVVSPEDALTLYKNREPQLTVVNYLLEDFKYALANVRANDGTLQVNKYLVGAMMSRCMLFHATWLKYHGTTIGTASQPVANTELSKFFQGAIDGAAVVMGNNKFKIENTYNALFSSDKLADNAEIVFYREYTSGLYTNSLITYNAKEEQKIGGGTVDAIDSYLCLDGLPIGQSPIYKGKTDPSVKNSLQDRDPRLYETFVDTLRIMNSGIHSAASPTGFAAKKFLNEGWLAINSPYLTATGQSPVDAPIIRYAEVLLNYVEARYEISKIGGTAFSQVDLDKSINLIRGRVLSKWDKPTEFRQMPTVTLSGISLAVNGTIINDPARDTDVDPVLWEIRRERRIELIMEGRRGEDLNRWAKFEYLNTSTEGKPNKTVLGAWIDKADYPGIKAAVVLYNPSGDATKGYINYYSTKNPLRAFTKGDLNSERNYLRAVPVNQITTYKDKGYTLSQNPGWDK